MNDLLSMLCFSFFSQAKSCLEKAVKLNWSFEKASLLLSSVYQKEKEYKKASVL